MGEPTRPSPSLLPFDGMAVCLWCGGLRGAPQATPALVQECECDRDRRRESGSQPPERWSGFDFNTHFELCRCCAGEVLRSGSRWSVWFCDECKARVLAFNNRDGVFPIPIGRHTMMVRGLDIERATSDRQVAQRLAAGVTHMIRGIDRLSDWVPIAVRATAEGLGLDVSGDDVDLVAYASGLVFLDKANAFNCLCAYWTS